MSWRIDRNAKADVYGLPNHFFSLQFSILMCHAASKLYVKLFVSVISAEVVSHCHAHCHSWRDVCGG